MKRTYQLCLLILIACFIFFAAGCGGNSVNPEDAPGNLTGTVQTFGFEPHPIAGATVTIGEQTYTTDEEGKFAALKLPAGTYQVTAAKADSEYLTVPASITITSGETTTHDFKLPLEPGSRVAFCSFATNLVDEPSNDWLNIFVYNRFTDAMKRITLEIDVPDGMLPDGVDASREIMPVPIINPSISADGRYVVFVDAAYQLFGLGIYVHDMEENTTVRITPEISEEKVYALAPNYAISADGRYIVYIAVNLCEEFIQEDMKLYRYDMKEGTAEEFTLTGVPEDQIPALVTISGDGNHALLVYGEEIFFTEAYGVYAYDFINSETKPVYENDTVGIGFFLNLLAPNMSYTGQYVVYTAFDDQVYLKDMSAEEGAEDELISATPDNEPGNSFSYYPTVSADGRYVAFLSAANNLVEGTPGENDYAFMYVRDCNPEEKKTYLVSKDLADVMGMFMYNVGYITHDGKSVVSNLFIGKFEEEAATVKAQADEEIYGYQIFLNDWMNDTHTLVSHAVNPEATPAYGNDHSFLDVFATLFGGGAAQKKSIKELNVHNFRVKK